MQDIRECTLPNTIGLPLPGLKNMSLPACRRPYICSLFFCWGWAKKSMEGPYETSHARQRQRLLLPSKEAAYRCGRWNRLRTALLYIPTATRAVALSLSQAGRFFVGDYVVYNSKPPPVSIRSAPTISASGACLLLLTLTVFMLFSDFLSPSPIDLCVSASMPD